MAGLLWRNLAWGDVSAKSWKEEPRLLIRGSALQSCNSLLSTTHLGQEREDTAMRCPSAMFAAFFRFRPTDCPCMWALLLSDLPARRGATTALRWTADFRCRCR